MTCSDVYNHALSIIAESPDSPLNDDYRERAQYLLASWCTELSSLDRSYRAGTGEGVQLPFSSVMLELEEEFPFCGRFAPSAAYFLASMLIAEENPTLSDRLYARYSDAISSISEEIPASVGYISDRYGFSDY